MKLVIAVVSNRDKGILRESLIKANFKSTILATTGGFIEEGNSTFLVGVEAEQVNRVVEIIKENCKEREVISPLLPPGIPTTNYSVMAYPAKITVGGAAIFVIDAEKR